MRVYLLSIALAFLMDLLLGDPRSIPHPVVLMGKLISFLEKGLRSLFPKTEGGERWAGRLLWLLVVLASFFLPLLLLLLALRIHPILCFLLHTVFSWQMLAIRSLRQETMKVVPPLRRGNLPVARKALSMIVGRDTQELSREGIVKACVETVAENTADGIIAPLFYLFLGGAPLAMLYKAVNTMDSMIGYIDPPYTHLGRFAAKADDVFNFLPARLCALLLLGAGVLRGWDGKRAWRTFQRDRYKHASPNSAQTESMVAGLLGVQLAGDASYGGHLHKKETIGDPLRPIRISDIAETCRLSLGTACLGLLLFGLGSSLLLGLLL